MIRCFHMTDDRRIAVCIDSYNSGILQGTFFSPSLEAVPFGSLSQFLTKIDFLLEQTRNPQAYTMFRTFSPVSPEDTASLPVNLSRRGTLATFEIQILYRQHSSWQGRICWLEKNRTESFRSALELIFLMNSALMDAENTRAC